MPSKSRGKQPAGDGDARVATTLVRGLRVLQAFRSGDERDLSNKEISQRTGLPKATVSRLIHTLAELGYISVDRVSGGYALAPGVLSFAHVFLARMDIRALARPLMQKLSAPAGTTIVLAMRDRLQMSTIEAVVPDPRFQLRAWIGASAPIARTASGHAHLAALTPESRDAMLAQLRRHEAGDWPAVSKRIARSLRSVATRGYCVEVGEWRAQINDVAVPVVLDDARENVLTLACGGPPQMLPAKSLERLGREMVVVGREI
jgi:DNA-binding IclR family transcriptional regulator